MEGPSEAKMSCTDNKDGSCSVEYIPYEPGTYNLNITYGGQPVKGDSQLQHLLEEFVSNTLRLNIWESKANTNLLNFSIY